MWTLLSELFVPTGNTADVLSKYHRETSLEHEKPQTTLYQQQPSEKTEILKKLIEDEEGEETKLSLVSSSVGQTLDPYEEKARPQDAFNQNNTLMAFLDDPVKSSNVLYWPCGSLSFLKSDFKRIMPPLAAQVTEERLILGEDISGDHTGVPEFQLIRSRHPKTLNRWIGYFLVFTSRNAAFKYYQETLGAELCGMQVNFSFVDPGKPNIHPPLLYDVPGISRSMCALVSGLPPRMSKISVARALWEYDLLDDEAKAIVKLTGDGYASQSSWLLRFKNEDEPRRLRRKFHRRQWPLTTMSPSVEIID